MAKAPEALLQLARHLRLSKDRFSLAFVSRDSVVTEIEALKSLRNITSDLKHGSIDVTTTPPGEFMFAIGRAPVSDVLHILGLDHHLSELLGGASADEMLRVLNLQRELWRESILRPVVLWLPDRSIELIARRAPDFWSWRSGIFDLPDFVPTAAKKTKTKITRKKATSLIQPPNLDHYDISRIVKYVPAELLGREKELQILHDAWHKVQNLEEKRPHILTFVALGGEGKTSLVAKWAAELAHQEWPGCDAAFAWSFYSQGTREQTAVSSDMFLASALTFFGDEEMAGSSKGAFDKGRRLAQLIGERRSIIILDGLEPLQYPSGPMGGKLKDDGLAEFLRRLASNSRGLCVVTTRHSISDLRLFRHHTAQEIKLTRLSTEAGVALLRSFGLKGTIKEFETLVAEVKGHALTLNLLGPYLRDAHRGDIRRRDLISMEDADGEQGGHVFRVMDAYADSLAREEKGLRALALLNLLGLFDRPASTDSLVALLKPPAVPGLTEPLTDLTDTQRYIAINRLEDANLLTINRVSTPIPLMAPEAHTDVHLDGPLSVAFIPFTSVDAHPLVREYFGRRLQQQHPDAWRNGHRRLYEHLYETTDEGDRPTIDSLQPLYHAVRHGCNAGLQQEVLYKVYRARIQRGSEYYSVKALGAFGSDLGAIASFFDIPWIHVSPALRESDRAWLLNNAASYLRALGRLPEAIAPMRASENFYVMLETWNAAAISAGNLSQLELTLGEVKAAVEDAKRSVTYADRSGDAFQRISKRTTNADALHQSGRFAEATALFREAEQIQEAYQSIFPLLYSLSGFQYCDLILAEIEPGVWRSNLGGKLRQSAEGNDYRLMLENVSERARQTLVWVGSAQMDILSIALDHLTLARVALYMMILEEAGSLRPKSEIEVALAGLRRAGLSYFLPLALLSRAWVSAVEGNHTGPDSAQADCDEAWEIAERGPMKLFMTDIHLYRARLFHSIKPYPWEKDANGNPTRGPKDDLADARTLIEKCGYWRRKEELEDAEAASVNW